jgi:hypothetical protein
LSQTFTVSDDAPGGGNTYHPSNAGGFQNGSGSYEIFYVLNTKAGATTLTVHGSLSQVWLGCGVMEFANSAGISPGVEAGTGAAGGDDANSGNTTSANQTVNTPITTTVNGDLIFGQVHSGSDGQSNAGAGFTSWEDSPYTDGEAMSQTTAGFIQVTGSIVTSGSPYSIEGIAFKHP